MEGEPKPRRFLKSSFYNQPKPSIIKTKTREATQESPTSFITSSNLENFSEHTNNSIDKLELPVLSQTSTQPDLETLLKSKIYTAEESEDELKKNEDIPEIIENPEKSGKILKKPKKLEILAGLQQSSTYTCEEDDSPSRSSDESQEIPHKRSRKFKKVYTAPLKKLNKLVDVFHESQGYAQKNDAEDDEIEVEVVEKQKSNKFLEKFKLLTDKTEKPNYRFAQSILVDEKHEESIQVKAPEQLVGFFVRKPTLTARDSLREQLRNEIINRKTTHIEPGSVFSKTSTELQGKKKVKHQSESEGESEDYVPDNDEALQAMEIEKMIKLEEGASEDSSELENTEESEEPENNEKQNSGQKTEDLKTLKEKSGQGEKNFSQLSENSSETEESEESIIKSSEFLSNDSKNLKHPEVYEKSTISKSESLVPRKLIDPSTAASENSPAMQKVFSKNSFLSKFLDKEAEIGSDHEEHDDLIKNVNDSESENGLDLDLEEIIDRQAVDENEDKRYEKHLNQLMKDDEDQIKKVINAEFRKHRKDFDFVETSNILNKKQQLLEEKKKILQARGFNPFAFRLDQQVELDGIDDEEIGKYQVLRSSQELKLFRSRVENKKIIDDQSLSLLNLISEPEKTVKSKSLLSESDSEKSSLRVFKTTENFSSNRSFVFSKEKTKNFQNEGQKPRNTKLFSLFSR